MNEKSIQLSMRVRLYPSKKQEIKFWKFCGIARWVWNTSLTYMKEQYQQGIFVSVQNMIENLQDIKYQQGYEWLIEAPESVTKQSIKDLDTARKRFLKSFKNGDYVGFPKYHKKSDYESFYQRTDKIRQPDETHVMITKVGKVKTDKFKLPSKVGNPRVKFDGKHWYLTFCYTPEITTYEHTSEKVGIDLGIKNLATVSNGVVYENINNSRTVKILERRKKLLQRRISHKYDCRKKTDGTYKKSNNIKRLEKQLRVIERRLRNIRNTYLHTVSKEIVSKLPDTIVIEDLHIKDMLKDKHLSKSISKIGWYKLREYLNYKCNIYGVSLIVANRYYASSQICSCCKSRKPMPLSKRTYSCPKCNLNIDRDINAALNLAAYAN